MLHRRVDEYDIRKLEQARDLVSEVASFYYMTANGRTLYDRLHTIERKLTSVIDDAREYQKTHERWEES